jgi:uncharacterized protein (TIGR03067 family)
MTRLALFAVLTLALTVSAQDKKDVPKELIPFQGTWKVIKAETGGKPLEKDPAGVRLEFADDMLTVYEAKDKKGENGTITVDPKKEPAELDFFGLQGQRISGIYKFDKDGKLTLCIVPGKAAERPKSFDTTGTRARLFVLEKTK